MNTSSKCFIVAEVAQSHDGSLGMAHAYIDAISKTGADAVKFQTHIAEAETTIQEPWRVKFSTQDKTRYEYWKRMEFSEEHWFELRKHADKVGLKFLSSPFSLEAVELLKRVGVCAWKIASGEVNNPLMLDAIAETGQSIFLSTGMSPMSEIDRSVKIIQEKKLPLTVLQCTSVYPTPPEKVGLNMIGDLRNRYNCGVGLSDHSGKIYPGLAATVIGIEVLEVHVTLSKEMFGPDVTSSMTVTELKMLVEGVRFVEKMKANDVDKDKLAEELCSMRKLFTKSITYKRPLLEGTVLGENDLTLKKPGNGLDAGKLPDVIGKTLKKSVSADETLLLSDLK